MLAAAARAAAASRRSHPCPDCLAAVSSRGGGSVAEVAQIMTSSEIAALITAIVSLLTALAAHYRISQASSSGPVDAIAKVVSDGTVQRAGESGTGEAGSRPA